MGVESPDVKYCKSRLIFTFITINLMAAGLGLNKLAESNSGNTTLGRTSLIQSQTVQNIPFPGTNTTIEEATLITEYQFQDDDVCQRINNGNLAITESECDDIRTASVAWIGMGVASILLLFVLFLFLLRIECRKLCSKRMRQICIGLLCLSFLLTTSSWIALIASPIPSNFDALGSSFWITMLSSITTLIVLIISIFEYNKVGGGAASAAK